MEIDLGCGLANVSVNDDAFSPVVTFQDVPVIGDATFCNNGAFGQTGRDLRTTH
jgi:hypothetical protein